MRDAMTTAMSYYSRNEDLIEEILDGLIASATPEPGDIPAFTFAALAIGINKDPSKAVAIAAAALMRLGQLKWAGEPS